MVSVYRHIIFPLNQILLIALLIYPVCVFAEGSVELGPRQGLQRNTILYVDILNPAIESVIWTGYGSVTVTSPDRRDLGSFSSGQRITPLAETPGAYKIQLSENQFQTNQAGEVISYTDWDVTVYLNTVIAQQGRLWSKMWSFNAGDFSDDSVTDANYFSLVPGGEEDANAVIEVDFEGLAGYIYNISGNRTGISAGDGQIGLSVPASLSYGVAPEFRMYLNLPVEANYRTITPIISGFSFVGGPTNCNGVAPGLGTGSFIFDTNVIGTYHLICDLNHDNIFDIVTTEDLHLIGPTEPGSVMVYWDGFDNVGNPVDPDTYQCKVKITVGEFHYVGHDIETSYCGIRMYDVNSQGNRIPLNMFWNDSLVQFSTRAIGEIRATGVPGTFIQAGFRVQDQDDNLFETLEQAVIGENGTVMIPVQATDFGWKSISEEQLNQILNPVSGLTSVTNIEVIENGLDGAAQMRNSDYGSETSGTRGINSGPYEGNCLPDGEQNAGNARSWGNFNDDGYRHGNGKGNRAYLDTYTWLGAATSTGINVVAMDPDLDTDEDQLTDFQEDCIIGTNPDSPDTDNDGVDDFIETNGGIPNVDLDQDGLINARDPDDDNDGLLTIDEDLNHDTDPTNDDSDGDDAPNYLDPDDDNDNLPTIQEDVDHNGDPRNDNTDNDELPNYLDPDDDGDGVPTLDEDLNRNLNPVDDDLDDDGIPNYLDPDDDGDGLLTEDEDVNGDHNPQNDDSDNDVLPDYLDADDDNDLILTKDEDVDGDGDPSNDDTDEDGIFNYLDTDDDNDTLDSVDEDVNEDGDPSNDDTDDDEIPDYLDADDDGDGIDTVDEDPNGDGDPTNDDTDGDGILNYLDFDDYDGPFADPDDDGILNRDDNCPNIANDGQENIDDDEWGDLCDSDIDNDGLENDDDNCPYHDNPNQENQDDDDFGDVCDDDADNDGVVTDEDCDDYNPAVSEETTFYADPDEDNFGDPSDFIQACASENPHGYVTDGTDNCPFVTNPDQADTNEDGVGDQCDPAFDTDSDGVTNDIDNCPEIANPEQTDTDNDHVGDFCDQCPDLAGLAELFGCPETPEEELVEFTYPGTGYVGAAPACECSTAFPSSGYASRLAIWWLVITLFGLGYRRSRRGVVK